MIKIRRRKTFTVRTRKHNWNESTLCVMKRGSFYRSPSLSLSIFSLHISYTAANRLGSWNEDYRVIATVRLLFTGNLKWRCVCGEDTGVEQQACTHIRLCSSSSSSERQFSDIAATDIELYSRRRHYVYSPELLRLHVQAQKKIHFGCF